MITYDNLRDKGFPPSECDYIYSKVKEAYEQGVKFAFYDNNSYAKGYDDAIEKYRLALHQRYADNELLANCKADADRYWKMAVTNLDLEEIDIVADFLKEHKNEQ